MTEAATSEVIEDPVVFRCGNDELVGVIARGPTIGPKGVLIVVGGPQYRVGSHRQFVLLARALAEAGFATFRIDYRGMGDASGDVRSFESVDEDLTVATAVFRQSLPQIERVVIWGLCDAASAALMHVGAGAAIDGLVLLNPWARSEVTLAKTHLKHYYGARLLQADFWRKLASGRFEPFKALSGILRSIREASKSNAASEASNIPFQTKMARGWRAFQGRILIVLSGNDLTAKEFLGFVASASEWKGLLERPNVDRFDLAPADHTFSTREWRHSVESRTIEWLKSW